MGPTEKQKETKNYQSYVSKINYPFQEEPGIYRAAVGLASLSRRLADSCLKVSPHRKQNKALLISIIC